MILYISFLRKEALFMKTDILLLLYLLQLDVVTSVTVSSKGTVTIRIKK